MNYIGIDIGSTASKVVVRGSKEAYFGAAHRLEQQGDGPDYSGQVKRDGN